MELISTESNIHHPPRWFAVGSVEELSNPGDYITALVENEPVVVLINDSGEYRAMSRVCRHRGFDMLEGVGPEAGDLRGRVGTVKRISCPYHAWTYNLDGQLIGAPVSDSIPEFDKSCVSLPQFDVTALEGVIFVCLDKPAPNLMQQLEAEGRTAAQIKSEYKQGGVSV